MGTPSMTNAQGGTDEESNAAASVSTSATGTTRMATAIPPSNATMNMNNMNTILGQLTPQIIAAAANNLRYGVRWIRPWRLLNPCCFLRVCNSLINSSIQHKDTCNEDWPRSRILRQLSFLLLKREQ